MYQCTIFKVYQYTVKWSTLEDVEERIKEILKEHGRMRSTELERMIVEDEGICAKKTFYN